MAIVANTFVGSSPNTMLVSAEMYRIAFFCLDPIFLGISLILTSIFEISKQKSDNSLADTKLA